MRTPTYRQLKKFCQVEGWEDEDALRGRPTGDHFRYRLTLPNGKILRTRVSHGSGQVGGDLFKHILRDQLQVSEREFWAAVDKRTPPDRGPASSPPGNSLPAALVDELVRTFGLADAELRTMSEAQARERLRAERRRRRARP